MSLRRPMRRRRPRRPPPEEQPVPTGAAVSAEPGHLSPFYNAGPALDLAPRAAAEQGSAQGAATPAAEEESAAGPSDAAESSATAESSAAAPLPLLEGQGQPETVTAFNRSLRLEGRTDATYDGGAYKTRNVRIVAAPGCADCDDCIRARGTLVVVYSVSTTVSLPRVADFPDLTPCQRRRVQDAINNVLAPHEQEHVRAFNRYNGTTRRAFDLTLCRSELDSAIEAMFQAEAGARQAAVQAASDALDPFYFEVDLDCQERPARRSALEPTPGGPPDDGPPGGGEPA